jgi:DNA-binding transcriptional ArsR family regulator
MADLSPTLFAIADPSRRLLLQRLAYGPATSGQLAKVLTSSRPAATQHLGVLKRAGLVRSTPKGRNLWHELSPRPLIDVERWIRELTGTWAEAPTLDLSDVRRQQPADPTGVTFGLHEYNAG